MGDPTSSITRALGVSERLEDAWNAGDVDVALALFADGAVAASSAGEQWHGKRQLAVFLVRILNIDESVAGGVETMSRCARGDRVIWSLRYPGSGATATADLTVDDGQIVDVFWDSVPSGLSQSHSSRNETAGKAALRSGTRVAAGAIGSCTLTLIIIALARRSIEKPQRKHGRILRALHNATVGRRST